MQKNFYLHFIILKIAITDIYDFLSQNMSILFSFEGERKRCFK